MQEDRSTLEEWRPIPGWPGSDASSMGRIRGPSGRVLRPSVNRKRGGYLSFHSRHFGTMYVHKAVLMAFLGPKPDGAVTRHLDGNSTNNRQGLATAAR